MTSSTLQAKAAKTLKTTAALAGALILGALGNGVWELFLKDSLVSVANGLLTAMVWLWSGYLDVLHREIGKLRSDSLMILPFSFFAVALTLAPIISTIFCLRILKHIARRTNPNQAGALVAKSGGFTSRPKLLVYGFMVPSTIAITFLNVLQFAESTYSRRAGVWAERCIEIVAPNAAPEEHLKLRSELRAVESAKQFYALHTRLSAIAKAANVSLPKFVPVGIPIQPDSSVEKTLSSKPVDIFHAKR